LEGGISHNSKTAANFMILADGQSIPFDRFMEYALYHPQSGYYRKDPHTLLGRAGDFFTASQLQPVFGALIASLLPDEPVWELGAGREEMRAALAPRPYRAPGIDDSLPSAWRGSVFANEFFDALPVAAGILRHGELRELLVTRCGQTYQWTVGAVLSAERRAYVQRYYPALEEGARFEIAERAVQWIRRINECLVAGTVLIIDYGWHGSEYLRLPEGSLMSYRRHTAHSAVLENPGSQDITAHVPFGLLMDCAREHGFTVVRFETLAQTVLTAMERSPHLLEAPHLRQQLKTILFGLGESFRTLVLNK
jgi:SAM-dependent MidA family methyltransferase